MKKVSIFLAEGFEEVEALTPADLLRRAGAEVTLVSIGDKKEVAGSHGIIITADRHPEPESLRSAVGASERA